MRWRFILRMAFFLLAVTVGGMTTAKAADNPKYFDILGFYKQGGVYVFRDLSTDGKMLFKSNIKNEIYGGLQTLNVKFDVNDFENKYLYCSLGGRLTIADEVGMCNFTFNNGNYSFEQVGKINCEWNCLRKDAVNELLRGGKVPSKKK